MTEVTVKQSRRERLEALVSTEPGRRQLIGIYRAACPTGRPFLNIGYDKMVEAILDVEYPPSQGWQESSSD